MRAAVLFVIAGLAEIGGGYLIWLWLRDGKSLLYGMFGAVLLIAYGMVATVQSFSSFGRVYAAYGGIFIVLSILWGWWVDRKSPDAYDWAGMAICLIGALVMLAPRR
ncbi:YnfA family protein [Paenibacillus pinistramenti]|uniref:YnfA family protein n=1 Tax=Paenibacillus pinistramenti TaxID=1768003 RepID=UPI001109A433|nr:YnfA family protein [Paenibacillus pinistramenti]